MGVSGEHKSTGPCDHKPERTILVSVGTSALNPRLYETELPANVRSSEWFEERALRAGLSIAELLGKGLQKDYVLYQEVRQRARCLARRLQQRLPTSAELDTVAGLQPAVRAGDRCVLIVSDTPLGALAGRIIGEALEERFGQEVRIRYHVAAGVDVDHPALAQDAYLDLIRVAMDELERSPGRGFVVVTAGYKPMAVYLTLAGLLAGARVVYQHETSRRIHSLPPISLMPDLAIWNRYFPLFDGIARSRGQEIDEVTFDRLVERWHFRRDLLARELTPFIKSSDGTRGFSALGQVLHEKASSIHRDGTTGLYRRSLFEQSLHPALQGAEPMACGLVVVDVDRFKQINDTYGHEVGDRVLAWVANKLAEQADAAAGWPLRWGGEEFLMLLIDVTLEQARQFAEELRRRVAADPYVDAGHRIAVTVSCGVSWTPATEAGWRMIRYGFDDLFREADEALYAAKRSGRNHTVVAPLARQRAEQG